MKRFILTFLILFGFCSISYAACSTVAYVTADDVTVTALEQNRVSLTNCANALDGGLVINSSITSTQLDANTNPVNRWNEAFVDFVFTGLTIPTSGTLSSTTTLGTAYVNGIRVLKDATSRTYTASKHTFVDVSDAGIYTYSEVAINDPEPGVTADSIRIARVSTDGTTVLSVRDDRITTAIPAGPRVFIGSFTRDVGIISGTQSVTGVGFKPASIHFISHIGATAKTGSWGFSSDAGSGDASIRNNDLETADTFQISSAQSIQVATGAATTEYVGNVSSYDSDGFTITWTKIGGTTGSLSIQFIAYK